MRFSASDHRCITLRLSYMKRFTIRVELKSDPTFPKYEALNLQMAKIGFMNTVEGATGPTTLPHAIYYGQSEDDIDAVLEAVISAAHRIDSNLLIFVAETVKWVSYGGG